MDAFDAPTSTREEILAAAYRALCDHGYAAVTMEKIGAEFDKSVSLVYHHYDDKDDLVLSCLEFMLDSFEEDLTADPVDDPGAQLEEFVGWQLEADIDGDHREFLALLTELRSQACHDAAYRQHFTRTDSVFQSYLVDILQTGIERGEFEECDPQRVADHLLTLLAGVSFRRVTTDDESDWLPAVQQELDEYLTRRVYRK